MYIVNYDEKGKKVNYVCSESISFQVLGTGNITLETSIDNGKT
jgi:hypothetical protein